MKFKGKSEAKVEEESACGYVATGPGFYLWEETHREALRAAGELAGAFTLDQARELSARMKASGAGRRRRKSAGDADPGSNGKG